ncbi:hypothetical protein BBP40_010032 [Aspergillus hancockii]|nr:hypothetical protein BBP40_010032 [Aspergillus hancockii]
MGPSRVQSACVRCRQQKLKCDDIRPCQLCVRCGVDCVEGVNKRRRTTGATRPDTSRLRPASITPIISSPKRPFCRPLEQRASHSEDTPSSTFQLVAQVFRTHLTTPRHSDAIPDGISNSSGEQQPFQAPRVPVRDLIHVPLPPLTVTMGLLDAYLQANHWYLTLFYEPTFRAQVQQIVETGSILPSQKGLLMLLLAVLVTGARFADVQTLRTLNTDFDTTTYQADALDCIEKSFYLSLEAVSLERPSLSRAWVFAQHKLSGSTTKRGGLRYTAQAYGKPSMLTESTFRVTFPDDLDDMCSTCPGLHSVEVRGDGVSHPVTTSSYNRFKVRLYAIAAEIRANISRENVYRLHTRLVAWENSLPPELRPHSFRENELDGSEDPVRQVFALQALTLQISYDNIRLVLLRPFLCAEQPAAGTQSDRISSETSLPIATIRRQLFEAAARTSHIDQWPTTLQHLSRTVAAMQVGFHCFTAGVVLGMLALSELSSPRLSECQRALARVIHILEVVGAQTPLCNQSIEILTDMMHLIASQEVKRMISHAADAAPQQARQTDEGPGVGAANAQQLMPSYGTDLWSIPDMSLDEHDWEQSSWIWLYDPLVSFS